VTDIANFATMSDKKNIPISERILYEDNHIIVVNKLAGEIVQGDKTGDIPLSETLKDFIRERDNKPGNVFIGVPHRLDRPVSGLCVFAKTSKALERLNAMFSKEKCTKLIWRLWL
jgi:23S rRNA pseudouridine1911/1915/1917 synthase